MNVTGLVPSPPLNSGRLENGRQPLIGDHGTHRVGNHHDPVAGGITQEFDDLALEAFAEPGGAGVVQGVDLGLGNPMQHDGIE